MQTVKKQDRRVIKTKKAIRAAFIKLLLVKDYNKITIKDIATEADVDRKTVYNYYKGIYEISEELENELIIALDNIIADFNYGDTYTQTKRLFVSLTEIVNDNNDICNYLFKLNSNSQMMSKLILYVKEKIMRILSDSSLSVLGKDKLDIISAFIAAGAAVTYQNWFNSNKAMPVDELTAELSKLVLGGLNAFRAQ